MITAFFTTVFYQPLYNGLVALLNILPLTADAALAVILFTIIVKLVLFPLALRATYSQMELKEIEGDLQKIREKYKNDKEAQTSKTIELYKEKNINPFAGLVVLIIQFPIIIALYRIFLRSGLPKIDSSLLYHFVSVPMNISMHFLWIMDISGRSVLLAFLAGLSTYFQVRYSVPADMEHAKEKSVSHDVTKMLQWQMKFFFPILVFFISWTISAAVSLYWITNNLFTIAQEMYFRKRVRKS